MNMVPVIRNQLSRREAQFLFDYRDGALYWRHTASGRRPDLLASLDRGGKSKKTKRTVIGGVEFLSHYLVWNWHNGKTDQVISFSDSDPSNIKIENLVEVQGSKGREVFISAASGFVGGNTRRGNGDIFISAASGSRVFGVLCPCCRQKVDVPTFDVVVLHHNLAPMEARILSAVWRGGGYAVQADAIFNEMYADDQDGGPEPQKMHLALKVALSHMRQKLRGSGISIETVGYRKGYKLVMKENDA